MDSLQILLQKSCDLRKEFFHIIVASNIGEPWPELQYLNTSTELKSVVLYQYFTVFTAICVILIN